MCFLRVRRRGGKKTKRRGRNKLLEQQCVVVFFFFAVVAFSECLPLPCSCTQRRRFENVPLLLLHRHRIHTSPPVLSLSVCVRVCREENRVQLLRTRPSVTVICFYFWFGTALPKINNKKKTPEFVMWLDKSLNRTVISLCKWINVSWLQPDVSHSLFVSFQFFFLKMYNKKIKVAVCNSCTLWCVEGAVLTMSSIIQTHCTFFFFKPQ